MIIQRGTNKYYAPDSAATLDPNTGVWTIDNAVLIPFELYELYGENATINDIKNDIASIDEKIKSLSPIPYPDGATLEQKDAIDAFNEERDKQQDLLTQDLQERYELLEKYGGNI